MTKGPYMEFLRAHNPGGGDAELTETVINLPTSKTEKMAVLIHQIDLMITIPSGGTENLGAVSTVSHMAAEPSFPYAARPGMLMKREVFDIDESTWNISDEHFVMYFDPPVLVAKDKMYLIGKSSGCTNKSLDAVIGYTLEKVTQEDFIDALVE